jgi:hypothetical protein
MLEMPDVDATQGTPLLKPHAPMLVNNAIKQTTSFSSALLKPL